MDQIMQKLQAEGSSTREWSGTWNEIKTKTIAYLTNPEIWTGLLLAVIKIFIIYLAARIIIKIANKALQHMMIEREKSPLKFDARRTKTIGKLIGNIVTYVVNFIMILMILSQFGVSLAPVLAGAGVVGLAVGFGAQSLVKDVITGFFIIFEDQFAVGDVIQVGTYKGTVEEIGLRVTRIKSWTGEEHIIPNGTITQVTNFSIHNSLAIIDVLVSHESDLDKAMRVLEQTVKNYYETDVNIVKEPELLGVQMIGASDVTLRVTAECKPVTQAIVARKLNAEIRRAFKENGLESPYPRLITYHKTEKAE